MSKIERKNGVASWYTSLLGYVMSFFNEKIWLRETERDGGGWGGGRGLGEKPTFFKYINVIHTGVPAHDQHVEEWVRKQRRMRMREYERKTGSVRDGGMRGRGMVSHYELSTVIILQCHLRHWAPHPAPPLSSTHGNNQAMELLADWLFALD